ncbi:ImmA/IrrE family metallo-endopeptidase [Fodinicola acaciae]|uniref:ImmA/IrrE family metallo-endopeptidase n=1 Tax=Fodinicola acaciae TaxID=2681555 RepID=UPI0013D65DC6|nr:ImmA/IrrE family metallo-endopeptidase [Fodinicola acaciae]
MEELPTNTIHRLRDQMPSMLDILPRGLTTAEARLVAERQASLLLRLLDVRQPCADIERLLELPELEVEFLPGIPESGTSAWRRDHWHIRLNSDDDLWRSRVTLAHEFKHILDDPFREQLYPGWTYDSDGKAPRQAEEISDYFAGCVLVPKRWLVNVWYAGVHDVPTLAATFDVSESLILTRLEQTGIEEKAQPEHERHPRRPYTRAALPRLGRRLESQPARRHALELTGERG